MDDLIERCETALRGLEQERQEFNIRLGTDNPIGCAAVSGDVLIATQFDLIRGIHATSTVNGFLLADIAKSLRTIASTVTGDYNSGCPVIAAKHVG